MRKFLAVALVLILIVSVAGGVAVFAENNGANPKGNPTAEEGLALNHDVATGAADNPIHVGGH